MVSASLCHGISIIGMIMGIIIDVMIAMFKRYCQHPVLCGDRPLKMVAALALADVFYFPHHYCQHQHQCYHHQFYNDYFYFTTFDVYRDILLIVNITLLVP